MKNTLYVIVCAHDLYTQSKFCMPTSNDSLFTSGSGKANICNSPVAVNILLTDNLSKGAGAYRLSP